MMPMGYPDYLEPLVGYRSFKLADEGGVLFSPFEPYLWKPGVNQAHCNRCQGAPAKHCKCGLYAYKSFHPFFGGLAYVGYIIGQLQMWGRVEEHQDGYRSEFALISAIYKTPFLREAETLSDYYQVPVIEPPVKLSYQDSRKLLTE